MVPMYSCAVTALAIHPVTNNLVIAYSDQQVGAIQVTALLSPASSLWLSLWPWGFLDALLHRRALAPGRHRDLLAFAVCRPRQEPVLTRPGRSGGDAGEAQTSQNHPLSPLLPLKLFEFSIPEKQYTAWSRMVQNCGLHKVWLERDSPITHIAFNPKNPSHILLHDIYMFCVLDKSLVSPRVPSRGLGLRPGRLPCPAVPIPSGSRGRTAWHRGGSGGPDGADACRALSLQPLPDNSALLMNQSTLKQLPETARQRQLHAFKICKKFQVGDGVARCALCRGGGLGGCPAPVVLVASPALVPDRSRCRTSTGRPSSRAELGLCPRHGAAACCGLVGSACPAAPAPGYGKAGAGCGAALCGRAQQAEAEGSSTMLSSPAPQPLLFADLLDENCLVMVERPIMDIKTQLPLPIQQKKFGT